MKNLAHLALALSFCLIAAGTLAAQERTSRRGTPAPAEQAPAPREKAPAPAEKAPAPEEASLADAQAAFRAADSDSDGQLDAAEAGKAGIDGRRLQVHDKDNQAGLSRDEFILAYQEQAKREKRPVADDLAAESKRIAAAQTEKSSSKPAGKPVPTATGSTARGPSHEEKLQAIKDNLNSRVRKGNLDQAEALAAYERVSKRLDNALLGAAASPGKLSKDEYLKQVKESLNRRVRKGELSQADSLAVYERVSKRIETALASSAPAGGAQPTTGDSSPAAPKEAKPAEAAPAESPDPASGGNSGRRRRAPAESSGTGGPSGAGGNQPARRPREAKPPAEPAPTGGGGA